MYALTEIVKLTEGADASAYDPAKHFAVVYEQKDADHYVELARAPTGFRAKTAIFVPQLKRYYVAAPRHGTDPAGVKVYEVQ